MKNFKEWGNKKEYIHNQPDQTIPYFREGEIWWSRLGVNIGFEQDGKNEEFLRPVLILKKFNQFIFWALPLSTKFKNNPYYVECCASDSIQRTAIISQLRLISSKRITTKITYVKQDSFLSIKKSVKVNL